MAAVSRSCGVSDPGFVSCSASEAGPGFVSVVSCSASEAGPDSTGEEDFVFCRTSVTPEM